MATGALTDRGLRALKPGRWVADPTAKGAGTLQARRTTRGVAFYFRYTSAGTTERLPIGLFDPHGESGLSLVEARERAGKLSKRYVGGERDLRAALARDEAERERAAAAKANRGTLGLLLGLYADDLESRGKPSARAIRNACVLHVKAARPGLWAKPAAEITLADVLDLLRPMVAADHKRMAGKLRSYIRAAYAMAIASRSDVERAPAMRALRIESNPAANVPAIESTGTRDRVLSVAELRAYWSRIAQMPGSAGAALRFHLLSGGQRIEQLGRITASDYDADSQTVRLLDPKGRRKKPRDHHVPLVPEALAAMEAMRGDAGPYLVSVTSGLRPAAYATLCPRLRSVVAAMVAAGELENGSFTLGDLRRTVETRLAALGVSSDARAQVQSHGLGGIQSRHYDRHDYLSEKRAALEALHRLVTDTGATVVALHGRVKA